MPQEGMLVQIDGSNHPWLEDRGPKLTLLIVGDEAVLRAAEDTRGYLMLRGVIQQWGITLAVYSDRRKPITVDSTRFARVMRDLSI